VRRISILLWSLVVCTALSVSASAQMPMTSAEAGNATTALDAPSAKSLNCFIETFSPVLDFALRFQAGYVIHCRLKVFEGQKVTVQTYLRITPSGKVPVLLSAAYGLPAIAPDMLPTTRIANLKQEVGMSGAFGVGEGDYSVELLATDDRGRVCRKSWKIHVAANHSQRRAHLAIPPLTVEPFDRTSWEIPPSQKSSALRLTILLDAAPIRPYESSLHARDRAFLLEALYSLLRQVPFKSVRLVAFNLEQQREIYRRDGFDGAAFLPLSHALHEMETATVSVQALKSRSSALFLSKLTDRELTEENPADAIIFLGPASRMDTEIGADWLTALKPSSPPFFYFKYFGAAFPDSLQRLMTAVNGKTFLFLSPPEFDQDIQKMLAQLKQQ
jgi:hypothetical protein